MLHPGLSQNAITPTLFVSQTWLKLNQAEREGRVRLALENWSTPVSFELRGVSAREVRVALLGRYTPDIYGAAIMALERRIRKHVGEPLELYCELRLDRNPQRTEVQARIAEWRARREQSRTRNMMKGNGHVNTA